ncbi:uncharacterized protein LOC115376701 [Myripristis murdjan]|uniref:uncharacterized protein LOC115376701 n=1 Tax=Myripristis murdjan TaxID=586833 RepID=UPI0011761E99|nr:uncharacterized protein LOC115376701 [Myripristis murdjan]
MICILLLLVLPASVCGKLVMNVSQTFHQAKENSDITMEWTFTPVRPLADLNVFCAFWLSDHATSKTLYHLQGGVEHPESQDEQFAGRVQCDEDDLRKGLVRIHLSRLRSEDSGVFQCEVFTEDGDGGNGECLLTVTAAKRPPESPEVRRQRWVDAVVVAAALLTLVAQAALVVACGRRARAPEEKPDPLLPQEPSVRFNTTGTSSSLVPSPPLIWPWSEPGSDAAPRPDLAAAP